MPALTREVQDSRSPVARWLRATFPHHHDMQADYREAAGPARVLPTAAVSLGTQGAAIDWWMRFLIDPAPSVSLAAAGLRTRRVSCRRADPIEPVDLFGVNAATGHRPLLRLAVLGRRVLSRCCLLPSRASHCRSSRCLAEVLDGHG